MKKLLLSVFVSTSILGFSQSKYLSISGGYGLGIPGNEGVEIADYSNVKTVETRKYVNFGSGLNVEVAFGSPLGKNAHFELALGYQNNLGAVLENSFYSTRSVGALNDVTIEDHSKRTIYASSYSFAPGFRFMAGEGKTRGFAKVAPQVIFAQVTGEYEFKSDKLEIESADEYSREFSFGFVAALGFERDISEKIVFFSSIKASLGYYSPKEWALVKYEYNGREVLENIAFSDKQIYYEDEVVENGSSNSLQATRALRNRMDYSSISLNLGFRFLL